MLLNRQLFVNFAQSSSIGIFVFSNARDPTEFGTFYGKSLGKELARRLQHFPDGSMSGFTQQILATLILADLLFRNVVIVLEDLGEYKAKEFKDVKQSGLDKEEGKDKQEEKIVEE